MGHSTGIAWVPMKHKVMAKKKAQAERRTRGLGSVYKDERGRWIGLYTLPRKLGEKRVREKFIGKSEREAEIWLHDKRVKYGNQPQPGEGRSITFAQYARRWLADIDVRPTTKAYYENITGKLIDEIGTLPLADVDQKALKAAMMGKTPAMAQKLRIVAGTILQDACDEGVLNSNAARLVKPPETKPRKPVALTRKQVDALLQAARSKPLGVIVPVLVLGGLRIGEALGLTWADVDLKRGWLYVTGTLIYSVTGEKPRKGAPKTDAGTRKVPLVPEVIEALKAHRKASKFTAPTDFVFCTRTGGPVNPRNFTQRVFEKLIEETKLPKIRLHDLRHAAGSWFIESKIDPATVAAIMGHANAKVTLGIYTHSNDDLLKRAAETMRRHRAS